MELRVLRYFLTVAREENISKAAEALFITQPTLSRQMQELEEELGVRLFLRGKRKITLTDEGMLLRRRAEEMLDLDAKVTAELKSRGENLSGIISVGAAETRAFEFFPRAIVSFRERYPLVAFDIYSDIATHIKDRIDRGLVDFGLLIEPGNLEKYDFIKLDISDRCGVLMNKTSPLAERDYVTIDDLEGVPVLINARREVRDFYRAALGPKYDDLNVLATFNLINNAAFFAEQNCACVFTIESTVRNLTGENLCFRPFLPETKQETYLIWKKHQSLSRPVSRFLEELTMLLKHK